MGNSLERLAEMVRLAEARAKSSRLETDTRQAAEALRAIEAEARRADTRLRERRPELQKALAQVAEDEQALKDLTRKVAQLRGTIGPDELRTFEAEFDTCRSDIEGRRLGAESELEELTREAAEVRARLAVAVDTYHEFRIELERLRPESLGEFSEVDGLARSAENLTPAGQLRALTREVEGSVSFFGMLERAEQYAQLAIWIGRHRRLQAHAAEDLGPDSQATLQRLFHRLVGLSKQYEPGYIEAFRQHYHTDWDQFIAEHEQRLRQATESARQKREADRRRQEQQTVLQDRQQQAQAVAREALDELRFLTARGGLAEDSPELEAFFDALDRALGGMSPSDPELLDLVRPQVDYLTGASYRALRKHLARIEDDAARTREEETFRDSIRDVIAQTRGLRALVVGGSPREERRRKLEALFEFSELDWEAHEDKRPAALASLRERVRGGSVDVMIIIKSLVGHAVSDTLRPLCEEEDVPCLMVEGYGEVAVAEALRRGLVERPYEDGTTARA